MYRYARTVSLTVFVVLLAGYSCKKDPIHLFFGTYHVTGYYQFNGIDTNGHWTIFSSQNIDTSYVITKAGANSLLWNGNTLNFVDTGQGYNFDYESTYSDVYIAFNKPYNDSIFITAYYELTPSSGHMLSLQGKKIQ
jgi:hypothetical protein